MKSILLSAALLLGLSTAAHAQVTELRIGGNIHDIDYTGAGSGSDKERSVALNAEVLFAEPEFLKWAFTPQPYIGGALNLEGETSYGGAGLLWRQTLGKRKRFYIDLAVGLVVHDGTIEAMPSALVQSIVDGRDLTTLTDAQRNQFLDDLADFRVRQNSEIDFGSRVLFREQLAVGYKVNDDWSGHIFVEHLSHGNILVSGRPNEGLDTLGFRVARHF